MGSKILKGNRSLTLDPIRKLAARFKVGPEVFVA
jgi:antitoxin component HigA of HigAB toxin-antitoxin module